MDRSVNEWVSFGWVGQLMVAGHRDQNLHHFLIYLHIYEYEWMKKIWAPVLQGEWVNWWAIHLLGNKDCQLRLGILPLHLERGRYSGKPENERFCNICNSGEIENENHFLFTCEFYQNEHQLFLNSLNLQQGRLDTFINDNISNKLKFLLNEKLFKFGKYIENIYTKRRRNLYK